MAWYREWFGEEYLELYAHRDRAEAEAQADFVQRRLGDLQPRAVLDLACGAGRHTDVLRHRGYRVLGIDLSLVLLTRRPDLPRVAGDMQDLPFGEASFDWVLNFFTSFGYFETERENFRVLEEVIRVLAPGGRFLIDLMNPEPVIRDLQPRDSYTVDDRRVEIERWYDAQTKRVNKRIKIKPSGRPERTYLESVRAYRHEEVLMGLRWAGFEVTGTFGNFHGDPYTRDSQRLILVGRKSA